VTVNKPEAVAFPAFWILLVIGSTEELISKGSLRAAQAVCDLISQRNTLPRLSDAISEPTSDVASTTSRLDWKEQLLYNSRSGPIAQSYATL
jgi:hypothetical protein